MPHSNLNRRHIGNPSHGLIKSHTPISNGGLNLAPPGHSAGYARRAGFAVPFMLVASIVEACLLNLRVCHFLLGF